MAIKSGTPVAPAWVAVLEAAKEWGCPPWKLAKGSQVLWWTRWNVYRDAIIKAKANAR